MHRWYFIVDDKYYSCAVETGFVIRYSTCIHLQNNKSIEENHDEFFKSIVEFNLYNVSPSTKDEYDAFIGWRKNTRVL